MHGLDLVSARMPTVCRALCCGSHEHSSRLECSLLACFRYLGNDFIFSFIAVALIPVYYARKSVGWLLAALLTVGSFAITTYDIIHYNLGAYVFDDHYRSYAPPRVACTCAAAQRHHLMHRLGTESGVSPLTVCTLVGFTGQVLGHGLLPTMEPHPCVPRRCVRCMGPRSRAREPVEGATFAAEVACNACTQRAASRCIRIASALWQVPSYPVVTAINVAAVGVLFFIMFIVKTDFGEQANKWTGCDTRGSSAGLWQLAHSMRVAPRFRCSANLR